VSSQVYGRYRLIKRLASGGMAEIYLAQEEGQERRPVVVKRILPHLAESPDFVKMFLNEARIAVHLNHPNIVQIFDLGEANGTYYLAMDYIHGEDVRRVWKRLEHLGRGMPVMLGCRIVIEACRALQYAHAQRDIAGAALGIVHRDVSPQNILLTFQGEVKLVDFGIAKAATQGPATRSGVLKGKYAYMSPEQAHGKRLDRRTDIFAAGVILWELVTGQRLFKRGNDIQTLNAVMACEVRPPSELNPKLPTDLDAVILKALAKDPDERYQEAGELQRALEGWLADHGLRAGPHEIGKFMRTVFADRLAQEKARGELVLEEAGAEGGGPTDEQLEIRERLAAILPTAPMSLPPPPQVFAFEAADSETGLPDDDAASAMSLVAPVSSGEHTAPSDPLSAREAVPDAEPESEADSEPEEPSGRASRLETEAAPRPQAPPAAPPVKSPGSVPRSHGSPRSKRLRLASRRIGAWAGGVVLALAAMAALAVGLRPPPPAHVVITTEPAGVEILFNTKVRLKSPATLPPMPPGRYAIELSAPGYIAREGMVEIPKTGEYQLPVVKLDPAARPVAAGQAKP
jgi:serine/threonine protein kinase